MIYFTTRYKQSAFHISITKDVENARFENDYLRLSWVSDNYDNNSYNIEIIEENNYYLIKVNEKYLGIKDGKFIVTDPIFGNGDYEKWVIGTNRYDNSHYFILEENNDVNTPYEESGSNVSYKIDKKIFYIKDKNTNKYLCMDNDGWVNINNSGCYLLIKK
jgi:hypothetical protein